jgi:hypothetical protein
MPLAAGTTIDDTTWAALALILTILGAAYTWFAWRRSGLAAGLRGLAWTLIPVAAWLTGSLKLITGIVEDIVNWAAKLVFSPVVWLGIVVAGVAVALWVLSGFMRARDIGVRDRDPSVRSAQRQEVGAGKAADNAPSARPTRRKPTAAKPGNDDIEGMDEIEAILKRHGI